MPYCPARGVQQAAAKQDQDQHQQAGAQQPAQPTGEFFRLQGHQKGRCKEHHRVSQLQPGPGAHQGGQHGKGGAGGAWDGQAGANGQVDQDHKDLGKHRVHPACQLFQTLGPGHSHHSGNGQPHGTDGQAQKGRPEMDACLGSQVRRKDQVASPEKHGKQREADEQQLSAR